MNHRCRPTYFVAMLAVLFLALGPALAPLLATGTNARTIEICTAFGMVKMALAGDYTEAEQDSPPHGRDKSSHCVFCQSREMALLPQGASLAAVYTASINIIWIAQKRPEAPRLVRPYQSRAPPVLPA